MARQPNYSSRHFTRGTKAEAYAAAKDRKGIARCPGCTTRLTTGRIHYDHITPWEICGYSGPDNCQPLCTPCHRLKTGAEDVPMIAANNRVRDRDIGARTAPRHPMPCGRRSRWSKRIGAFGPVPRQSLAQKHAATMAKRGVLFQPAEA